MEEAQAPLKIAIVGSGAAGLAAAYALSKSQNPPVEITIYEAASQLGGHANTVIVDGLPIDTGFLVYNENTYPNLIGMFEELGVPTEPSVMSFAVSLANRSFEWSSNGLDALFATRSNLVSPAFYGMIRDIVRFNKEAPAFLADAPDATVTMGAFLDARGYGAAFRNWYLVPQVAAVWSSSAADVLSFPASTFITFCVNHSLLQLIDRPQWRTVSRRSAEYVRRLVGALDPATTTIKLSTSVESVVPLRPRGGGTASSSSTVIVRDAAGGVAEFDHVVFGAHPDTVRDMLLRGCSGGGSGADENTAATTTTACAALDAFVYSSNTAVLHRDPSLMPARRSVWASWNYMGRWGADATAAAAAASAAPEPCCVTYYLNLLQNLPPGTPDTFLTLNPTSGGGAPPDPRSVISTMAYAHPQYTVNTVAAQGVLADVQGGGHMWFAGAYTGYGFHEDAITSGLRVAHAIVGVRPRWWDTPMYTTPSLLLLSGAAGASAPSAAEAVRVLKASGGPYWRDNLGNGGLVGRATSEVAGIAVALRRAAATATAASSSSSSAAAALVAKGSKGASIVSSGDSSSSGGTVSDGGVTGHMLVSPGDVLFAYRRLVGHAQEAASAASSSSSSGGGGVGSVAHSTAGGPAGAVNCVTTVPSSSLSSLRAAGLASPFSSSACTSSSSTNTTAFSRASSHESSDDSEEAVSGEEQEREDAAADGGQLSPPPLSVSAATPAGSSNAARPTLRNRRTGTQGAGASLYIRAGSSGSGGSITTSTAAAAAAAASERVNVPTPGANSTITWSNTAPVPHVSGAMAVSALRSGSSASVSRHNAADASTLLTGHFTDVRAFKSSAVAGAIAAATAAASAAHSGPRSGSTAAPLLGDRSRTSTSTTPLGDRMAGGVGGYTVQEAPLQAPDAHPSLLSWAMQAASYAAAHIAASPVLAFLRGSVRIGCLCVRTPDGVDTLIGDPSALPPLRARLRVHSWAFFARAALEADIGLARSFIAGEWTTDDLTALFNVFAVNRERATFRTYGLWSAWLGASLNYASFALRLDNSIANSRRNISAHYDLSNDLFTAFLDPRSMMYSCGFFDCKRRIVQEVDLARSECSSSGGGGSVRAARAAAGATGESAILIPVAASSSRTTSAGPAAARPSPGGGSSNSGGGNAAAPRPQQRVELIFDGSLEEAQTRKLDHLIARSCVQPHHTVLDLGFGWGGLSIRLAQSVGCRVHGITLSKEQLELATERVAAAGVAHLVTFEIVDYRDFAKAHRGEFDRIISIEMIEAVGHNYFGSYVRALDDLLAPGGIVVLQAIMMPEHRYEEYIRSADFINTFIFPGGCCPSLGSLTDALAKNCTLQLHGVDSFALHYGETLRRWRANFNAVLDEVIRPLGFDDAFIRTWNYYLCYCEAGFSNQVLGLQVLTLTRGHNESFITDAPYGKLADPLGPFINDAAHPVLVPAGCY